MNELEAMHKAQELYRDLMAVLRKHEVNCVIPTAAVNPWGDYMFNCPGFRLRLFLGEHGLTHSAPEVTLKLTEV